MYHLENKMQTKTNLRNTRLNIKLLLYTPGFLRFKSLATYFIHKSEIIIKLTQF